MPFVAVNRGADLGDGVGMIEFSDAPEVANQISGRDFQG